MRHRAFFAAILVALLQTGAIGAIIAKRAIHLAQGREILIDVIPVDPRDFLRGDYVRLSYSISSVNNLPCDALKTTSAGVPVFVTLERKGEPEEGKWAPVAASTAYRPLPESDAGIVLRGVIQSCWPGHVSHVTYGIESYFVPESTGGVIEGATREGAVKAVISVDRHGNAAIKGLIVNGTRHGKTLY